MATSTTTNKWGTIRIPFQLKEALMQQAKKDNCSVDSYVTCLLNDIIYDNPNPVTMAAIEEARSGKELETLDLKNFKQYVASL